MPWSHVTACSISQRVSDDALEVAAVAQQIAPYDRSLRYDADAATRLEVYKLRFELNITWVRNAMSICRR